MQNEAAKASSHFGSRVVEWRASMLDLTGTCFIDAVRYGVLMHQTNQVKPSDRIDVVHGVCTGQVGTEFVHAWAEWNGFAWQGANENGQPIYFSMLSSDLRTILKVSSSRSYLLKEAIAQVEQTRHFGPWDPDYERICDNAGRAGTVVANIRHGRWREKVSFGVDHGLTDTSLVLRPHQP